MVKGLLFAISILQKGNGAVAKPLTWAQMEDSRLMLVQELRHSSGQKFKTGGEFHFQDLVVGDGFLSFQFQAEFCKDRNLSGDEIDLVLPPGGNERTSVGVQVGKDCLLQVFVETKDLQSRSFFEDSF